MKPVFQTKFGGSDHDEEEQGNCIQACLASIFEIELEEAPDFTGEIKNGKWWDHMQEWLAKRNLAVMGIDICSPPPPGIGIMSCKSIKLKDPEDGHVVVVKDGKIIHNPTEDATEVGEKRDYWMFVSLDPAKVTLVD